MLNSLLQKRQERGVDSELVHDMANQLAEKSKAWRAVTEAPPRNQVALPMTDKFNGIVGADMFYLPRFALPGPRYVEKNSRAVVHFGDFHLWYGEAAPVLRMFDYRGVKIQPNDGWTSMECAEALISPWAGRWGPPDTWFFDLGKEFDNQNMEAIAQDDGSELSGAPGRAHWSHGMAGKRGKTLKTLQIKTLVERPGSDLVLVVEESNVILNASAGFDSASASQRLVGFNPRLRGLLEDDPGQLMRPSESERAIIKELAQKHCVLMTLDLKFRKSLVIQRRVPLEAYHMGEKVFLKKKAGL